MNDTDELFRSLSRADGPPKQDADRDEGEIEELEERAEFYYTRTEVLLYLLCTRVPAIELAALVSQSKSMSHEMFEPDARISGLRDFVSKLILDLMQVLERCEKDDLEASSPEGPGFHLHPARSGAGGRLEVCSLLVGILPIDRAELLREELDRMGELSGGPPKRRWKRWDE